MYFDGTMTWTGMETRLIRVMGFEGAWNERMLDRLPFVTEYATA